MARDDIPTSRIARGSRVGKLAAGQAVKHAGTRAANLARSPEAGQRALERRYIDAAEQMVTVLGTMKGAALKVGQMLSFLDLDLVPEDARPEFQRKLAALREAAPNVSFDDMQGVIEADLGRPVGEAFADFEREPIGAASIGQVYRATLTDGRDVAVKVQYPRIVPAVRADLKNLSLLLRIVKRVAPGLDTRALAREIRGRIEEELDYRLEARNQAELAELFAGHPFIAVPAVVEDLCGEHVLVMDHVEGIGFDDLKGEPAEVRDRVGEIVYRFYCGSLYRHGRFSGDPHPGNLKLQPDGRVAFLDFGLFKRMDRTAIEFELACQRAAAEGDAVELHRLMAEAGILPEPDRVEPELLLGFVLDSVGWYLVDEELELTPELATSALIESADPRSSHFAHMRWQHLPSEHAVSRRMELFTLALLGQLRASANWHRIAREWLYDEAPATELGELEHGFRHGVEWPD